MASAPDWSFADLSAAARWVLAYGMPTVLRAPTAPLSHTAWAELKGQAADHGLDGLLIAAVADRALPTTPSQRADAAELEMAMTNRRIVYDREVAKVLDALVGAGISVRVVKGASLGAIDYPDVQQRPTSDLDLVVRPQQIRDAIQVLQQHAGVWINPEPAPGFLEEVAKGATVALPSGLEVDLHRILVWGPFGVRLDPDDLWKRSRSVNVAGATHETLGLEETFVHICLHLMVLGSVKAREVRDVAQLAMTTEFDPERAAEIAQRWGVATLVAGAVLMAERELAMPYSTMPLVGWAREFAVPVADRMWRRTESPNSPLHGVEQAAMLWELKDWRHRKLLLTANFAPLPGTDRSPWQRIATVMRSWVK